MKKKYTIGIMQGRLTEPRGRGIQFFPFDNWEQEFYTASKIGLDEIEFIFDYDNYIENPLWNEEGINNLKKIMEETKVKINAVCFDYFMRRAFYKHKGEEHENLLNENREILQRVLKNMHLLGIELIEIPLVDDSALKTEEEKTLFSKFLLEIVNETANCTRFGLETDLPPKEFKDYLNSFRSERIGANYDSGNSSGLGYDAYEEVTTLKDYIFNIHIKDRVYQGTTVKLGTGSANFTELFKGLEKIEYTGSFILQAARGNEGLEKENIKEQILFLEGYLK